MVRSSYPQMQQIQPPASNHQGIVLADDNKSQDLDLASPLPVGGHDLDGTGPPHFAASYQAGFSMAEKARVEMAAGRRARQSLPLSLMA